MRNPHLRHAPALLLLPLLCACSDDDIGSPAPSSSSGASDPCVREPDVLPAPEPHTPRWAFEPWISKDSSNRDDTYAFVGGFQERDIPVGVVVLDSPWETNYNTFVPNPDRYPEFAQMVTDLRAGGVRVVLWVTQMTNESSFDFEPDGDSYDGPASNFQEALDCGYFIDDGLLHGWWKGSGGAIDFDNESAAAWWHRQQDPLFDMGVAGFKLDFGDSYVRDVAVLTARGVIPHQQYSERYYQDFHAYGVSRAGKEEFVTMVRAWDESYDFAGRFFARRENAPVAWMGDNRRDWVGLADALDHTFRSAAAGYPVLGSDLGGYLDRDDKEISDLVPFDGDNFARWTAVSALSPFMQLHGRANLAPWTVESDVEETVALYRYWASLHHELVPWFYSLAQRAWAEGTSLVAPQGAEASWPGDCRYLLGDALLVAPILDETGVRDVALPAGARWYDWWAPLDDALAGGTTLPTYDASARERIPLFVREGAIVPVQAGNSPTGFGTAASADAWTVLVWPATRATSFGLVEEDDTETAITAQAETDLYRVELARRVRTTYLRVRADVGVSAVNVDGAEVLVALDRAALDAAEGAAWFSDPDQRAVWIKLPAGDGAAAVVLHHGG
ncbi:MAG: TIM-barrel domain-containing protein [Polyangiaceae bacterium]